MKKTIKKVVFGFFVPVFTSVILGSMLTLVLTDTMRGCAGRIPVDLPKIIAVEVMIPLLYTAFAYIGKRKRGGIQVYKLTSE